jgi:hypothetical protein
MVMVLSAGAKELLIVGGKKKLFKKRRGLSPFLIVLYIFVDKTDL